MSDVPSCTSTTSLKTLDRDDMSVWADQGTHVAHNGFVALVQFAVAHAAQIPSQIIEELPELRIV